MITQKEKTKLVEFTKLIGIEIKDFSLLKEALTHRSYLNELKDSKIQHNERLEFLGDAVLELIVTEFLFHRYPNQKEGVLTSFRAALVKTESLAQEAQRLDLGKYILMSKGEEATGGRNRPYILANTMEAILGATYLSENYETAKNFIIKEICYKIDNIITSRLDIDSKSKLQELAQETAKITPNYELISSIGPDHNKVFEMAVIIGEKELARGKGKSKQEAEQEAAKHALLNWDNIYKQISDTIEKI